MAKKTPLFRIIRALLLNMQPTVTDVGYHSNPKNKRTFSYEKEDSFLVSFNGEEYFVRLNYNKDMEKFEVLIGHTRDRNRSGNNPDISLTESHFNSHFLLAIAPSLKRCGGLLTVEPKRLGNFPARVVGTKNRFLIGFPDGDLFPSLFRLCLAKKSSIDLSRPKRPIKLVKRTGST